MRTITDKSGRVKYRITLHGNKKIVKDVAGRVLGYMQDDKTFDASGAVVAYGEDPSALINE